MQKQKENNYASLLYLSIYREKAVGSTSNGCKDANTCKEPEKKSCFVKVDRHAKGPSSKNLQSGRVKEIISVNNEHTKEVFVHPF